MRQVERRFCEVKSLESSEDKYVDLVFWAEEVAFGDEGGWEEMGTEEKIVRGTVKQSHDNKVSLLGRTPRSWVGVGGTG